ncbi:MAG: sulfite dehydrogenase [Pseudomonadota bacterium]
MNDYAAGNGLINRRVLLTRAVRGGAVAGAGLLIPGVSQGRPDWMRRPGGPMSETGAPSNYEAHVVRRNIASRPGTAGSGASRTPLGHLDGIITPSRLHFERHHGGIPDIDPANHQLRIDGMVARPLLFSVEDLLRYPIVSRIQFLECSGNSSGLIRPKPAKLDVTALHGLVSCSEWGGVPLHYLLDEAGIKPEGKWVIASGADSAALNRSVPLDKVLDDAIVALYQNGERLRPANGYPMRLFLPGWEGNASVKWLRTLSVTDQPAMSREETSKYTDLRDDGTAHMFTFPMGVKSVITAPSPGIGMHEKGIYQISGIAWSGAGSITRVEVSADGGRSWAYAALDTHVLPQALTRFRIGWDWQGQDAVLLSRATDSLGNIQPTREQNMQGRARGSFYHVNAMQAWSVDESGALENTYV